MGTIGISASGSEMLFDNIRIIPTAEGAISSHTTPREGSTTPQKEETTAEAMKKDRSPESPKPVVMIPEISEPPASTKPMTPTTPAAMPEPVLIPPAITVSLAESPITEEILDSIDPFFDAHCYDCHDDLVAKGGLDLFALSTDLSDAENLRRWVRIFDRVKKGEMPPSNKPRPEAGDMDDFLAYLKDPLISGHLAQREVVLRRLNRSEYENTVNDLFGIDLDVRETFPADAKKHGFDNNGEGLTLSSELIQLYLNAANEAFDRAIGPATPPRITKIEGEIRDHIADSMYDRWFKLMEAEGGTVIYSSEFGAGSQMNQLKIPEAGTYRWRFHVRPFQSKEPVMMQIQTGQLTRQGDKRFIGFFEIPPEGKVVEFTDYMNPGESAYPRPFGTLNNISNFLGPNQGEERGLTIQDYDGAGLLVEHFELEGPLEEWPPPSRHALLGDVDLATGGAADAVAILERFLPRAFRRPVSDDKLEKYTSQVIRLLESGRTFEESLRWAVTAALCSPDFLFLEEPAVDDGARIDGYALASRLSYYLWSSMPDDELMDLAASDRLREPQVLYEQVERLLTSEKARAFTDNFAHQWLHLREIDATSPDTKLFPEFDIYLKDSMVRESESAFELVLHENRSIREFIDSDWVYINERLARHYDIPDVEGSEFRQVSLPADSPRGGLITHASVLKVTANGANTSPVERGVWILENLLGIHPPPPPPNIPAVVPDVTGAQTLRQLLATHSGTESCQSCHTLIDPPGFALESFDPVGAWRDEYMFQGSKKMLPVDSTGTTEKGQPFQDIRDYKDIILGEIDQVTYGLTEKLLTFGTGRAMGFSDRAEVHRLVSEVSDVDYRFRDLIHLTVQSRIFHQP
ncbi:MAG: DUF1592 domain-containing protein [Verrucomicrobiota bacterium]